MKSQKVSRCLIMSMRLLRHCLKTLESLRHFKMRHETDIDTLAKIPTKKIGVDNNTHTVDRRGLFYCHSLKRQCYYQVLVLLVSNDSIECYSFVVLLGMAGGNSD